jgi:hypothetical protein
LPNAIATRRPRGTVKADCIARAFDGWPFGRELPPVEALRTSAEIGKISIPPKKSAAIPILGEARR